MGLLKKHVIFKWLCLAGSIQLPRDQVLGTSSRLPRLSSSHLSPWYDLHTNNDSPCSSPHSSKCSAHLSRSSHEISSILQHCLCLQNTSSAFGPSKQWLAATCSKVAQLKVHHLAKA